MPCLMLDEASNGPVAGFLHDKRPDAMACLDTRNIAWTYHPPRIAMHRRSCCHCYGQHSSAFVRLPVRNSVGILRSFICSETCWAGEQGTQGIHERLTKLIKSQACVNEWFLIRAFLTLSWLLQNLGESSWLQDGLDRCKEWLWVSLLIKFQTIGFMLQDLYRWKKFRMDCIRGRLHITADITRP